MNITLKQILDAVDIEDNESICIEYRTNSFVPEEEEDIFSGICHYINGELIPDDGDIYNLEDKFYAYEWTDYNHLTVWYKSTWVCSEKRHCSCNEGECSCGENCECEVW